MQEPFLNDNRNQSFSMRKIPIVYEKNVINNDMDDDIDKIKILEFSNSVDEWEREILFSDKGFFSLKGKEVEKKSKEYLKELERFISAKVSEITFSDLSSKEIISKVSSQKLNNIKNQIEIYESKELKSWKSQVCDDAISASINKAVLYKSNSNIVATSMKNGLSVLKLMSEKEKWSNKTLKSKIEEYKSTFYYSLIQSFIQDKNINAYIYFDKYKDYIKVEDKENLEFGIKELKMNIIAYNWSKELYSYNLSDEENEAEIKSIKDDEIEKKVRIYLSDFRQSDKQKEKQKYKDKNIKNWEEIINILNSEPDKAFLYIDYTLKLENIKIKKDYIKKIRKNGYIKTDVKKFLELWLECFENFEEFKNKDISDYRQCLSEDDYNLFDEFQKLKISEFENYVYDYDFVEHKFQELDIKKQEDKYNFIKLLLTSKKEYESINKKQADIEARNKIINTVQERFKNIQKENKEK